MLACCLLLAGRFTLNNSHSRCKKNETKLDCPLSTGRDLVVDGGGVVASGEWRVASGCVVVLLHGILHGLPCCDIHMQRGQARAIARA